MRLRGRAARGNRGNFICPVVAMENIKMRKIGIARNSLHGAKANKAAPHVASRELKLIFSTERGDLSFTTVLDNKIHCSGKVEADREATVDERSTEIRIKTLLFKKQ